MLVGCIGTFKFRELWYGRIDCGSAAIFLEIAFLIFIKIEVLAAHEALLTLHLNILLFNPLVLSYRCDLRLEVCYFVAQRLNFFCKTLLTGVNLVFSFCVKTDYFLAELLDRLTIPQLLQVGGKWLDIQL